MRRIVRLVIALSVIALAATAAVATPASFAAQRMWVGFHDDPMFRFDEDRASEIQSATSAIR